MGFSTRKTARIVYGAILLELEDTDGKRYSVELNGLQTTLDYLRGIRPPTRDDLPFVEQLWSDLGQIIVTGKRVAIMTYDQPGRVCGFGCYRKGDTETIPDRYGAR